MLPILYFFLDSIIIPSTSLESCKWHGTSSVLWIMCHVNRPGYTHDFFSFPIYFLQVVYTIEPVIQPFHYLRK